MADPSVYYSNFYVVQASPDNNVEREEKYWLLHVTHADVDHLKDNITCRYGLPRGFLDVTYPNVDDVDHLEDIIIIINIIWNFVLNRAVLLILLINWIYKLYLERRPNNFRNLHPFTQNSRLALFRRLALMCFILRNC